MEDIPSLALSTSKKRPAPDSELPHDKLLNLKGDQFLIPTPPETDQSSNVSTGDAHIRSRMASPAPSSSAISTIESVSNSELLESRVGPPNATDAQNPDQPSAKRRKLTPAERLEQQQAREARDREKAIVKARKEEEKRAKDEEKRKKAEEREVKRREKELEEERKIQEKEKKERSQQRIGSFFQARPATTHSMIGKGEPTQCEPIGQETQLLNPACAAPDLNTLISPGKTAQTSTPLTSPIKKATIGDNSTLLSDYRKVFLPYQLPSHSTVAQMPHQSRTAEDQQAAQASFDLEVIPSSSPRERDHNPQVASQILDSAFADGRHSIRGSEVQSIRQLVDQIHGTSVQPIDLTGDTSLLDPMTCLRTASIRLLQFCEDVRPAYCGTYTKIQSPGRATKLRRNPFVHARTDTDYNYDSEAEWEEPEEGEDLLSDDEEEIDDPTDVEDIEGFLDDEDDAIKNRRRLITGDLVPTSTGLCWEGDNGLIIQPGYDDNAQKDLDDMRLDVLIPRLRGKTIDPFSTVYWEVEPTAAVSAKAEKEALGTNVAGQMNPPRPPLQQRLNTNASLEYKSPGKADVEKGSLASGEGGVVVKRGRKPTPKILSTEDLAEFKQVVVGSQLGKLDLLKALKSRFSKITQDTIKETLGSSFAQVGTTRVEKKWVYVGTT